MRKGEREAKQIDERWVGRCPTCFASDQEPCMNMRTGRGELLRPHAARTQARTHA